MSKINLACAHRHTHTHRHVFGPYLKCQACHLWGYLRWLTSCLWSGWPAPGSHGPNVSLPRHTEHTHTHMHSWWDLIRERKHGNNLQRKQNRCCWLGGGGAHLLIWAVFVLFYWAGANKDICAAERDGDNGAGVEKIENIQTPRYTSCSDLTNTLALYNRNEWLFWRRAEGLQW